MQNFYNAFIEDDILTGIGENTTKENALNIPVTEEVYILAVEKGVNYFCFLNGEIILNPNYEIEKARLRQKEFENNFFEIPAIEGIFKGGYYRKQPKGYQSAVESVNTCFNAVTVLGLLPADYLIFYTKPDFTDETQCTEEWLVANQFKNETMTAQEFGQFYVAFMTAWNTQEHQ